MEEERNVPCSIHQQGIDLEHLSTRQKYHIVEKIILIERF